MSGRIAHHTVCNPQQVLVCGPHIKRQALSYKKISLTDLKIEFPRSSRAGVVRKAWTQGEVDGKWEQTAWFKKLRARKARAELTDFDRFKVMVNRKKRSQIINKAVAKQRKA